MFSTSPIYAAPAPGSLNAFEQNANTANAKLHRASERHDSEFEKVLAEGLLALNQNVAKIGDKLELSTPGNINTAPPGPSKYR